MRTKKHLLVAAVLMLAMIVMTACAGGSLSADASNEKLMTITADKATDEHQITTGSIRVDEGDQVMASADLEAGTLKIELFAVPEEQSADELPEFDGEAVFMAILGNTDSMTAGLEAGTYMARITPADKATGTATISVLPAE